MEKNQSNSKELERLARKIEVLDKPERRKEFPPEKLLQMLPIKKTDTILDLGAGTGYLSIPAAQVVDGLVYALDLDPQILEILAAKAQAENINNIQLLQGSIDDIPLSDDSIDIVLASIVLHEVPSLSIALQQIKRVLKEDGYFLCVEFEKMDTTDKQSRKVRISSSIMEQELIDNGFSIIQKLFPSDFLYIFIAKK